MEWCMKCMCRMKSTKYIFASTCHTQTQIQAQTHKNTRVWIVRTVSNDVHGAAAELRPGRYANINKCMSSDKK